MSNNPSDFQQNPWNNPIPNQDPVPQETGQTMPRQEAVQQNVGTQQNMGQQAPVYTQPAMGQNQQNWNPSYYNMSMYQPPKPEKKKKNLGFLWGFLLGIVLTASIAIGGYLTKMPAAMTVMKEGGLTFEQAQELINKVDVLIRNVNDRYILGDPTTEELLNGAYHGLINSLGDKYSAYYDYEEFNSFVESGRGDYVGIGVTVQLNPDTSVGGALVISVNQRGGAYEQGLMAEDILIAADGVSFKDMTLNEMVSLMKGPEGTTVDVTYLRNGAENTVTIDRRRLTMIEVNYTMLENNIGYIAITEFDEVAATQFREAVDDLLSQGMEKLVIDLRDNPGGRVDVVCDIINRILPSNLITYMVDKQGRSSNYYSDSNESLEMPIVVLVNENSASASELMTGALKDHNWATIVGTTTFGKGIVQTTYPLSDGTAVKVTTAKYYTPNGVNIHGSGIEPDIVVELEEGLTFAKLKDQNGIPDVNRDAQLQKALEVLNAQ